MGLGCSGSVQHLHLHQAASGTLPLETSPTHMLAFARSGHICLFELEIKRHALKCQQEYPTGYQEGGRKNMATEWA